MLCLRGSLAGPASRTFSIPELADYLKDAHLSSTEDNQPTPSRRRTPSQALVEPRILVAAADHEVQGRCPINNLNMKPFLKTNKQTNKTNTDHLTSRQASFESVLSLLSSFFVPESEDAFMKWIERALGDRKLRGDMMRWRKEWKMLVEKGEHMSALL